MITSIGPSSGPRPGGIWVEITGSGFPPFDGITALNLPVSFGGVQTKAECVGGGLSGPDSCSVVTPPAAQPGPVHIIATAFGGSNTPSPADLFPYNPCHSLTKFHLPHD